MIAANQYHDTIMNWSMGLPITEALKDEMFTHWFQRYLTFRTVSLVSVTAYQGTGKTQTSSIITVPWPIGFGQFSDFLMNNEEAFNIMHALLAGERAGLLKRLTERGVDLLAVRQILPAPTM